MVFMKLKKLKIKVINKIGALSLGIVMFISPLTTSARTLSIQPERQLYDNWCWVNSARVIAAYKKGSGVASQSTLVKHVKGSVVNSPGTVAEVKKALKYCDLSSNSLTSTRTFKQIKKDIDSLYLIDPWYPRTVTTKYDNFKKIK